MAKTCKGCMYYHSLSETQSTRAKYCNYLLETDEKRGLSCRELYQIHQRRTEKEKPPTLCGQAEK